MNYLYPKNWTRLGKQYKKGQIENVYQKPKVLLSQICVVGLIITVPHLLIDLFITVDMTATLLDFITILFMVFVYIYNENGYYIQARSVLFFFSNVMIFLFANLLPIERGVYFYFFAFVALPFPMFSPDRKFLAVFIIIPVVLFIVTIFLHFESLEIPNVGTSYFITFIINLLGTAVIIIFSFELLINMNEESKSILNDLINNWNLKNKELEKANAELDRFVYSTSHELRSPLLSIQGLVNLALMDDSKEKKDEYLSLINKSTHKQDEFISEILQYSRNTRLDVEMQEFDVHSIIKSIVEECKSFEGAESINFIINSNPTNILQDKSRISIILKNLISNSVKYRDVNKESTIDISSSTSNGSLNLTIKDNGIGIDEEYHSKLYDMFFRATHHSTGSGLGLYIVKEMIDKLGGEIRFESEYGSGTLFQIDIPVG